MEEVKLIPREIRKANFPIARFLSNEQQKIYEEACKQFHSTKAKKTLDVSQKGSNLFKVLFLNQIGIRTATLPELGLIVENNPDFLKSFYEDSLSVVLRSNGDSYVNNDYLAKSLAKLIKKRTFKQPIVINGLKIKQDNDSAYGLGFEQADNFEFFISPELAHKNNQRKFSRLDKRGMPIFDEQGNRTLYTRESGFSRLNLGRILGWNAKWGDLAISNSDGRVVVVSGEATSQKFLEEYVTKIQEKTDKEISILQERVTKFKHYLKTGKLK